jgi:hypothetical protein
VKLVERLAKQHTSVVLRIACVLAIAGLSIMMTSVVFPRPLIVIAAMSIGHGLGIGAFACYLLAVVLDASRAPTRFSSAPPGNPSDRRDA